MHNYNQALEKFSAWRETTEKLDLEYVDFLLQQLAVIRFFCHLTRSECVTFETMDRVV